MKTSSVLINRRIVMWSVALVLLTVATRLPLLRVDRPIDDEVVYAVAAQTIVDGGVAYTSAVERKPPLLFYVYAGVLRVAGRQNWRALHAVEVVWILGTMLGMYVLGRRLFDPSAGLIAALLYSIFQAWSYWNNLAFNGEVMMNLPIVWAYVLALSQHDTRRLVHLCAAGALIATGFLLKQPAAIVLLPIAMMLLPKRAATLAGTTQAARELASLTLGFVVILAAAATWLLSRGLLADAFYWTITDHTIPQIYWGSGFRNTTAFIAFCLPITAGAFLSCRDRALWRDRRSARNVLIAFSVVSLVGAFSSGRFFPHYFIAVVPSLAWLAAPWLAELWRTKRSEHRLAYATQVWLAATVIIFAVSHMRGLARQPSTTEAGDYLRAHSSPDDRIFVWGQATRIYLDAQRRPASRYIATFPLTGLIFGSPQPTVGDPAPDTRDRIVPGSWAHLREDFSAHEPKYIVDNEAAADARYPVNEFPALLELLKQDYQQVAWTSDGVIYKRDPTKTQLAFLLTR